MLPDLFDVFEKDLIGKIQNSESPFLGLFEDYFPTNSRNQIISCIQNSYDPIQEFIGSLSRFPAILSTLLVVQLLEDFGEDGHFAVYPVIGKIFGEDLTQSKREALWRRFRRACLINLGISVSPRTSGTHYMVEEYLRQAGLPLRFVDKFTQKAIRYANQAGIPDTDDPDALKLWQAGLLERLNTPFPETAKRAIERDDNCYYSQQFIELFSEPSQDIESLSRLQTLILKTITDGSQTRTLKRAAIPQIVLRELEYGVLIPGGEQIEWQITIGEDTNKYSSHAEDRFVPFDTDLPLSVTIRNSNGAKWDHSLWEDTKDNRLLIFSLPNGKFVKKASLSDKEVYLDPGEYSLLMRFMPEDDEGIETFNEPPLILTKRINLNPGQQLLLERGPVKLILEADNVPALNLTRKPLRGVRGNELYPSKDLILETIIPDELKESETNFYLTFKLNSLGDEIRLPLSLGTETKSQIHVEEVIEAWKPGVTRVLLQLFREDSRRPLVRKTFVVWKGLSHLENRVFFHCSEMPTNLLEEGCENLKSINDRKYLTYRQETNRFFKMAFDDGNRKLFFTWAVPGIFLNLLSYTNQDEVEKSVYLGQTLSVNSMTRTVLKIYASDPAVLRLGSFTLDVNFSRVGARKIPLASLVEYLTPDDNTLELIPSNSNEPIPLVHLVSPFEVTCYEVDTGMGLRKIQFSVANRVQALRVNTVNLIDGQEYHAEYSINNVGEALSDELVPSIKAMLLVTDHGTCDLHFPTTNWPNGFWLINFEIKANGRWGLLTDSGGRAYADGHLVSPDPNARKPEEVYWVFDKAIAPESLPKIFNRIHKALLTPYASQCWKNIVWLEKFWAKIGGKIARGNKDVTYYEMLKLSTERYQDAQMAVQIPKYSLGAKVPRVFCLGKESYPPESTRQNTLLNCFGTFSKLSDLYELFSDNEVDPAILFSFSNAMDVVTQQKCPQGFSLAMYKDAIKQRDINERWRLLNDDQWIPTQGDLLGPMHYRFALTRFQDAYKNSLVTNPGRRGKALFLARKLYNRSLKDFTDNPRFSSLGGDIDLGLFDYEAIQPEYVSDDIAMDRENKLQMIRFLSLFAQICRYEARENESLDSLMSEIITRCEFSYKDFSKALGYLIGLGEDLFAYYLLLWELVFTADCDQPRRVYVRS